MAVPGSVIARFEASTAEAAARTEDQQIDKWKGELSMAEVRPVNATMEWDGEQQFTGFVGKHEVGLDGSSEAAPTPVQMLALALMGCMSIDVVHILTRGRHKVTSLKTLFHGERSHDDPKRFTRIRLEFDLTGEMLPEHVERAIDLSREKYCSVWSSFRPDTELIVSFTIKKS